MILILKTGSTLENIKADYGDFEDWFAEKMQITKSDYHVHPTDDYTCLPSQQNYDGIIITGSPLMVTDIDLKEKVLANWILEKQTSGTPILGVCFGHQLLTILNGGTVEYNPSGSITRIDKTYLTEAGRRDALFKDLPSAFEVYKAHKQSVKSLPEYAEILTESKSGIIDAVKFSPNTWSLQFHPEFDATITRRMIQEEQDELKQEGQNPQELLKNVVDVDYGDRILQRFKELVG